MGGAGARNDGVLHRKEKALERHSPCNTRSSKTACRRRVGARKSQSPSHHWTPIIERRAADAAGAEDAALGCGAMWSMDLRAWEASAPPVLGAAGIMPGCGRGCSGTRIAPMGGTPPGRGGAGPGGMSCMPPWRPRGIHGGGAPPGKPCCCWACIMAMTVGCIPIMAAAWRWPIAAACCACCANRKAAGGTAAACMAPAGSCIRAACGCPTGGAAGALGTAGAAAGVAAAALGANKEEPPVMKEGMGSDSGAGALDRPAHLACEGADGAAAGVAAESTAWAAALGTALACALLPAAGRTAALAAADAAKAADTAALRASSLVVFAA